MGDTETLTRAVLTTDGRVLVEQPDGSYRPARGQTDWSEVDRMSETELAAAIAGDPDDPGNDPDFWERAQLVYPNKERVSLRLDADVLTWFRRQGRGYQSRINAILRRHYERASDGERPVIGSWTASLDYLKVALAHEPIEQFRVLFLDRKNELIRDEMQQRGTVDHTPLDPREIARHALELRASAVIMVHNHPSGDPAPSRADIAMTRQVLRALEAVGITLHDHVIVSKTGHLSLKSHGVFRETRAGVRGATE
jgi:DNA repair protein RadC